MQRATARALALAASLAGLACTTGGGGGFEAVGATDPVDPTVLPGSSEGSSGDDDSSGGDGSSDDGGSSEAGEDSSTGEPLPTVPCSTLDILVVIDNSDTMTEEQAKLTMAMAPFLALVDTQLPDVMSSIHVAVLATDDHDFVVANPTQTCTPYTSAANWMQFGPDIGTELGCATALGIAGDPDERPMQMMVEALSAELIAPGAFNDGFVREDGPLVVVILTDEEDDFEETTEWGSDGDPADWIEAITAVKTHRQNVVVLAMVGHDKPNACPDYQWNGMDGAELAPRLLEFTSAFGHHAIGDPCAQEYSSFLNAAVPEIVAACAAYAPA